jgi:hypothetical protein
MSLHTNPNQVNAELQVHVFLLEAHAMIQILAAQGYHVSEDQKTQIRHLFQRDSLSVEDVVEVLQLTKYNETADRPVRTNVFVG